MWWVERGVDKGVVGWKGGRQECGGLKGGWTRVWWVEGG